jgi:hypothetical protein
MDNGMGEIPPEARRETPEIGPDIEDGDVGRKPVQPVKIQEHVNARPKMTPTTKMDPEAF